jgi:hypothetical protein
MYIGQKIYLLRKYSSFYIKRRVITYTYTPKETDYSFIKNIVDEYYQYSISDMDRPAISNLQDLVNRSK